MSPTSKSNGDNRNAKSPPASARSPAKSPTRKAGKIPTRKDNVKSAGPHAPTLVCYGFAADLPIEAYLYCKDDQNDGYLNGYKKNCDGVPENDSDELTAANFTSYKTRRMPRSPNEVMTNGTNTFWRIVMLRYVPEGNSTRDTRAHGLSVLSTFLNSTKNTAYPISSIITLDNTQEENPHSLDMFFMDNDIIEIIKNTFDDSELNKEFYSTYKSLALKLWSGTNYPDFARSLGFP
jgi:hypothetical protein